MRPGVKRSFLRSGLLACALCCAQFLPGVAFGQDESLEARQNLLKERAVAALKAGDTLALYAAMDDFRLLEKEGAKVPPGLFFSEAAAARSLNDPVRTLRAFDDYFRVSPSEGEVFSEALRVYAELKRDIPETAWSLLEGMLPVPGGVVRADQASQGLVLQPTAGGELVVKPFSLGIREVTRAQFMEFVTATGYRPKETDGGGTEGCDPGSDDWTNPGFEQTADHPVVCVSWDDASAYLSWLSQWSGVRFRLPTSAEWELAARAGAATRYWYGEAFDPEMSNGLGATGRDQWETSTAPVGQFPPNPFGLRDMLGNVSEWVADCAEPDREAPSGCAARVVRGGNWTSEADGSTSSALSHHAGSTRAAYIGFRIAIGQ
jgi:formylglycine-generating enzyme required for sulfatase activity